MAEAKKSNKGIWFVLLAVAIAIAVVFYSTRSDTDEPIVEDVPDVKVEEPIDLDDSVQAQEITAIFRPGQREAFVLAEYTVRVKCRRGNNAGQWQTQVCP